MTRFWEDGERALSAWPRTTAASPKRLVVLVPEGQRLVKAMMPDRRRLWRDKLLQLGLFRAVYTALAS